MGGWPLKLAHNVYPFRWLVQRGAAGLDLGSGGRLRGMCRARVKVM